MKELLEKLMSLELDSIKEYILNLDLDLFEKSNLLIDLREELSVSLKRSSEIGIETDKLSNSMFEKGIEINEIEKRVENYKTNLERDIYLLDEETILFKKYLKILNNLNKVEKYKEGIKLNQDCLSLASLVNLSIERIERIERIKDCSFNSIQNSKIHLNTLIQSN